MPDTMAEVNLTKVRELVIKFIEVCAGYENIEVATAFAFYIAKGEVLVATANAIATTMKQPAKEA